MYKQRYLNKHILSFIIQENYIVQRKLTVVVRSNDSFSVATSNNRGLLTFDNRSRG